MTPDALVIRWSLLFGSVGLVPLPVNAQSDTLPNLWELVRPAPGEVSWAPLSRLRPREADYLASPQWGTAYAQIRMDAEAAIGNHFDALRLDDARQAPQAARGFDLPSTGLQAVSAERFILRAADTARVIIINERHHAASDRLLTLALLRGLWEKGYRYFAAETFLDDPELNTRPFAAEGKTGIYVNEPVFAEIVREARRLGYRLVSYEARRSQMDSTDGMTFQQRRDSIQALNLVNRVLKDDGDARILVQVGYDHARESATLQWYPMALYLRRFTGLNPVTIDQTLLSERSTAAREASMYRSILAGGGVQEASIMVDSRGAPVRLTDLQVDLTVVTPRTVYYEDRPTWMLLGGRRVAVLVAVPECASRHCVIEARPAAEPANAVPLDRAELERRSSIVLYVPPTGLITLRVLEFGGALLATRDLER